MSAVAGGEPVVAEDEAGVFGNGEFFQVLRRGGRALYLVGEEYLVLGAVVLLKEHCAFGIALACLECQWIELGPLEFFVVYVELSVFDFDGIACKCDDSFDVVLSPVVGICKEDDVASLGVRNTVGCLVGQDAVAVEDGGDHGMGGDIECFDVFVPDLQGVSYCSAAEDDGQGQIDVPAVVVFQLVVVSCSSCLTVRIDQGDDTDEYGHQ